MYFNESPLKSSLKMMKNGFCFMFKVLFVLEIFTYLSWLFGYVENGLLRKLWLVSKFMMSQTEHQIITINILLNIWRSKGNHNMRNITWDMHITWKIFFLKNNIQKVMEKLVPDPSMKGQVWTNLWITSLKCYKVCFYCMSKSRSIKIY